MAWSGRPEPFTPELESSCEQTSAQLALRRQYRLLHRFEVPPQCTFHIAVRNVGGSTVNEIRLAGLGKKSTRSFVRVERLSVASHRGGTHVQ